MTFDKNKIFLLVLVLLCCNCQSLLWGQYIREVQHRIKGQISFFHGSDPQGLVVVTLIYLDGKEVARTSTHGESFSFSNVLPGEYILRAEAEGFHPNEMRVQLLATEEVTVSMILIPFVQSAEEVPNQEPTIQIQSLSIPRKAIKELKKAQKKARKGNYKSAVNHSQKAIKIAPDYFEAHHNLGVYYYQLGNKDKSVEMFEKALSIDKEAAESYSNLGGIYLELGQPLRALPHLRRATQLDPSCSQCFYRLGLAYFSVNQFYLAKLPLKRSLQLEPVPRARLVLAQAYHGLGQNTEAVQNLRLYLQTDPTNPRVSDLLNRWEEEDDLQQANDSLTDPRMPQVTRPTPD